MRAKAALAVTVSGTAVNSAVIQCCCVPSKRPPRTLRLCMSLTYRRDVPSTLHPSCNAAFSVSRSEHAWLASPRAPSSHLHLLLLQRPTAAGPPRPLTRRHRTPLHCRALFRPRTAAAAAQCAGMWSRAAPALAPPASPPPPSLPSPPACPPRCAWLQYGRTVARAAHVPCGSAVD